MEVLENSVILAVYGECQDAQFDLFVDLLELYFILVFICFNHIVEFYLKD